MEDIDEILNYSSEEEEVEIPELVPEFKASLVYDEEKTICEWVNSAISVYYRTSCYQIQVSGSRYCYDHKCQGCNNARMTQGKYCIKCPCPVVGCNVTAYACGNRCSCCGEYHRYGGVERDDEDEYGDVMDVWRTCEACVCKICGKGPVVERYGAWGDVLLCNKHNKCVVFKCDYACDIDNPRYCPKHKHSICGQLRTIELCLLRKQICKDMRLLICKTFQKIIETHSICRICKRFYKSSDLDICNICYHIRERGINDIATDLNMVKMIFMNTNM